MQPIVMKTETATIDEMEVRTTAFPSVRQYKLAFKLGNSSNMSSDEAAALMIETLSNTEVQVLEDGKPPRWVALTSQEKVDQVLSGRPFKTLLAIQAFAIKVNFGDPTDAGNVLPDVLRP